MSKVQYRRRVVYCTNGSFALAHDLVEKGDKVAILEGSRAPVILGLDWTEYLLWLVRVIMMELCMERKQIRSIEMWKFAH